MGDDYKVAGVKVERIIRTNENRFMSVLVDVCNNNHSKVHHNDSNGHWFLKRWLMTLAQSSRCTPNVGTTITGAMVSSCHNKHRHALFSSEHAY